MAFIIQKNQSSFSGEPEATEPIASVSTHLFLKSPPESLERHVVLRRLRHHKIMTKVKNALHALFDADDEKWLQRGDSFSSP
ncbi:hypothetical protein ACS0TY_029286 [Phlomoides rotata]